MEYLTEADSSDPKKIKVTVRFFPGGGDEIVFTQIDSDNPPSQDEYEAWTKRYREAASQRSPGHPLIVDVVAEGLRPKR
jgi:hypothetical protein